MFRSICPAAFTNDRLFTTTSPASGRAEAEQAQVAGRVRAEQRPQRRGIRQAGVQRDADERGVELKREVHVPHLPERRNGGVQLRLDGGNLLLDRGAAPAAALERLAHTVLHQQDLVCEFGIERAQKSLDIEARLELARRAEVGQLAAALLPLNHALSGLRIQRPGGLPAFQPQRHFALLRPGLFAAMAFFKASGSRHAELINPRARKEFRVHVKEAERRRKVHAGEVGVSDQRAQPRSQRAVSRLAVPVPRGYCPRAGAPRRHPRSRRAARQSGGRDSASARSGRRLGARGRAEERKAQEHHRREPR